MVPRNLLLALAGVLFLGRGHGRVMTRCQLVKALDEAGIKRSLIANWVCLTESESSRNTTARGGPNHNGSYDHGIFQINDRYWCVIGKKGKDCSIDCNDLEKDDIGPSIACAQKIFARHGFNAWHGWKKRCQGKTLPKVDHCYRHPTRRTTKRSIL